MTMLIPLLLAAAFQQPRTSASRMMAPPQDTVLRTAYDSTLAAVNDVARAVADVRAETDRFRTRAFNDAIGSVLESARSYQAACQTMATLARQIGPRICRDCMREHSRPAFERFRAYLPSLTVLGSRCAARLETRVTPKATRASLRQTALDMSNMMVAELRRYEQRVADVRGSVSGPRRRTAR